MKFLYLTLFLIFGADGADADYFCKTPEPVNSTGIGFNIDKENLSIEETWTKSVLCKWADVSCYVDCSSFSPDLNVTHLNIMEDIPVTNQSERLYLKIGGKNIICNVTKCVPDEIGVLISESSKSSDQKDLKRPARIRSMCPELFDKYINIKKLYIRAEKMYIDAIIRLPFNETAKNYDFEEFNMTVVKMDMMNTTGPGLVQISAPKVPQDHLTLDVFLPTEPFLMASTEQHRVSVVTYTSAQLFINDPNTVLKSKVIRVETVGEQMKNLSTRLVINFGMNDSGIISEELSCRFYNIDASPEEEWDDMGSFTNLDDFNSSSTVTCSYDHMTPFAVLLVNLKIDPLQWKILSYISYIGCGLSTFFSAVTIFLYTFMKSSKRDSSIRIHVSLSAAVFLLNTSFLFTEWGATWSQKSLCVIIAVITQYSLLSCFSWMAIEAMHLYLLLIKVFNTYIKHYMIKLSLFGWGVPAVLVGGSLCVFDRIAFYGTVTTKMSDSNEITQFCWITDVRFLYGMNVSYFSITFLFNTSILVAVMRQIIKLRCMNVKGTKLPSRKDVCTILCLTLLLGMTWGLAFFSSGYTNYPVLYLFCICNSLQGLFLFLWFCCSVQKNKRLVVETSSMFKPTSTATDTYESSFSK